MNFVERYLEYYTEQQAKEKRMGQQVQKIEAHMLLSRKSSLYWQEYNKTLSTVKQMRKNKKSVEDYVDTGPTTLPGGRPSMSRNQNGNQSAQHITMNPEPKVSYKGPTRPQSAEVFRRNA